VYVPEVDPHHGIERYHPAVALKAPDKMNQGKKYTGDHAAGDLSECVQHYAIKSAAKEPLFADTRKDCDDNCNRPRYLPTQREYFHRK
jgi:hypothetical protein